MQFSTHGLIVFADIRQCSEWVRHPNVVQILEEFLGQCYGHLSQVFAGAHIKTLGDGAMIIQECEAPRSEVELAKLLTDVLAKICTMEVLFRETCIFFERLCGVETELRLGWGVTRGFVARLILTGTGETDWVSTDINTCAHMCKLAKPAGVLIDRRDFAMLPVFPTDPRYALFAGIVRPFEAVTFAVGDNKTLEVWASLAKHDEPPPIVPQDTPPGTPP